MTWYQENKERIRPQKAANMRKYRAANPEKYRKYWRDRKQQTRDALFAMYGDKCTLCGFSDKRALTLDHIKQNGNAERKSIGEYRIYQRALKYYRPDEYRILCMNCQFIERTKPVPQVVKRILTIGVSDEQPHTERLESED